LRAQLFGAVSPLAAAWSVNFGILGDGDANLIANLEVAVQPTNMLLRRTDETTDVQGKLLLHTVRLLLQRVLALPTNPRDMSPQYADVTNQQC
jgi:hypothetical protein